MSFNDDKYSIIYNNLNSLTKSDLSLKEALKVAYKANPIAGKVISKHLFTDTLCPQVGNKLAYFDFLQRHAHHGIHISLDANSFGNINKKYGFETGDEVIKILFSIISNISRKYKLKSFRVGGDECKLWATSPDRANAFVKELIETLEQKPKILENFKITVSLGLGFNPKQAEEALISAKNQLYSIKDGVRLKTDQSGNERNVVVSLLDKGHPEDWTPGVLEQPEPPKEALKPANPLK